MLHQLLAGYDTNRPLVDIGSSAASGLRHPSPFTGRDSPSRLVAHPIQHVRSLDAGQVAALGSDLLRTGLTFPAATLDSGGCFVDATGIRWVWTNGEPALLGYPLEHADVRSIRRHPRPAWCLPPDTAPPDTAPPGNTPPGNIATDRPQARGGAVCETEGITAPDGRSGLIRVLEPPCPGMLELAMALRNPWQFLHDITDSWRVAGELLDWSLETLLDGYTRTLAELTEPPDLVLYPDVVGFRAGMYLAASDFQAQYLPRLRVLLAKLRELSEAPVLLRCRGAVAPVLADLAAVEPELLQVQRDIAGLELTRLRATIPAHTALHGVVDLVRLGRALAGGDWERAAAEVVLLAHAWPAIAAPLGIVPGDVPDSVMTRAASLVRGLTPRMLRELRTEPDPTRVLAPLLCQAGNPDEIPLAVDLTDLNATTHKATPSSDRQ